jgi:hypothetical protein
MKYFTEVSLPIYETLCVELDQLLSSNVLNWGEHNQICLNSIIGFDHDFNKGAGSLMFDWNNSKIDSFNGMDNISNLYEKTDRLSDYDFTVMCKQFKGTMFETVYNMLNQTYVLGRVRLMNLKPKTCLSWHIDDTPRLHYPIITQEGCFLVIEDESMQLPLNKWYMADTTKKHTAFNGSKSSRVHLVAVILGNR